MRTSILLWSTFSGAVLGLLVDAILVGAVVLIGALAPADWFAGRAHTRWIVATAALVLAAIPLVLSILGYLEGELKAV